MKSVLIEEAEIEKPVKFPCLAKTEDGTVVLFVSSRKGTLVVRGSFSVFPPGFYSENWRYVSDGSCWTILPPGTKIELIQE
jgi:hypothetical protein